MADHRIPKIADREDEYRARRRQMIISPERYDPFAQGDLSFDSILYPIYQANSIICYLLMLKYKLSVFEEGVIN